MKIKHLGIELKKVKVYPAMSEETVAFSCEVYKDGKLLADVSNDGKGGCNRWVRVEGVTFDEVKEYQSLDAECDIMGAAEAYEFTTKNQSKHLCLQKDGVLYTVDMPKSIAQLKKAPNYKSWMDTQVYNFEHRGYQILNRNL